MTLAVHHAPSPSALTWGNESFAIDLWWSDDEPVSISGYATKSTAWRVHRVPAVEVLSAAHGHRPASSRLAHTDLGLRLRHIRHEVRETAGSSELLIVQRADDVEARWTMRAARHAPGFVSSVELVNLGARPLVLLSMPAFVSGFSIPGGDDDGVAADLGDRLAGWNRVCGRNDWLGEGRWSVVPLRGPDFPRLSEHLTGHNPRGSLSVVSHGTWSTGAALPVAAVVNESARAGIAWEIEHNGPWRWEIGEDTEGAYVAASGPTESDASWSRILPQGGSERSVPVRVVVGASLPSLTDGLTALRRELRRPHGDNAQMSVVFNDYMNTLNGDPTTEKLLPLIAGAAEVGAEIFCIDAGWYDDGYWWDSVGEWMPSTRRFPNGLREVVDAIRDAGMVPGLWLEPEVIGVKSPMAEILPDDAFLQRAGVRIVEHDRYHLDLRHPSAVAHLDDVIDRLVREFGIGFFKIDYNVNPGAGTDVAADSVGDGLLQHNRAHLAWLDRLLDRHPELVIENCSSGAMRADAAMLSRLSMQSTSDQQDFLRYPPIAASAPMSMLPEQAASWAYPQPDMTDEGVVFCLVTGLLGRFYVSGHVNEMNDDQRHRVAEAIQTAKSLRGFLSSATPAWPTGLPSWDDPIVSHSLRVGDEELVSIWRRGPQSSAILSFPHFVGRDLTIAPVFPSHFGGWSFSWNASAGELAVYAGDGDVSARTLRLNAVSPEVGDGHPH